MPSEAAMKFVNHTWGKPQSIASLEEAFDQAADEKYLPLVEAANRLLSRCEDKMRQLVTQTGGVYEHGEAVQFIKVDITKWREALRQIGVEK